FKFPRVYPNHLIKRQRVRLISRVEWLFLKITIERIAGGYHNRDSARTHMTVYQCYPIGSALYIRRQFSGVCLKIDYRHRKREDCKQPCEETRCSAVPEQHAHRYQQ